jgi:hypothetical protein
MKKLIKNQFSFLTMLIVIILFSSINTKMYGQIVLKTLGTAVNAYTQVGPNRTRVSYSPGINTLLFVHSGAIPGSSGNQVMYDISANGGSTWFNNLGPVIDLTPSSIRYPQGYIMNPANNTIITNARIIAATPKPTGVNNGWGRITSGMVTLSATGKKESTVSDSAFIPNSFVERIPGEYWMVSDTNSDGKITLYKGVYSLSGDSVLWTVALKLAKSRTLFDRTIDGNVHYVNPMIAFSPNGQVGWIATNGEIAGSSVDSTLYPIFWSTTNGGQTWTGPQIVRLKNLSNVVASVNSTKPTATRDNDLVVDKNGNPHFVFVVAPKTTAYSYNNPFTIKYPIFDITKVNNVWTAVRVDTVSSLNGASFGTLTHGNEIQLSRTKDGSKIFYCWTDTRTPNAGANSSPNLFIKGYNVDSNYFGPTICPTRGTSIKNLVYLPNVSEIVSDSSLDGYKIHTIIATPTGNENMAVGFSYLDNLYYKFNNSSTSILPNYIPKIGLVGYYPFNGNADDESGNWNDGIIVGGVYNTTDRFGKANSAFVFNGTDGHINISSLNSLTYRPITYSAWVIVNSYLPSSSGHKFKSIVGRNTAFVAENGVVGLYADNNVNGGTYDNTFLMWRGGGVTSAVPYSASIPALNTWIHIAYTQEANGDWKWYKNGVLTNSGNFTNIQNDFNYFQIGGCNNQSLGNTYWNGKLDDIGIWNRALTQSEITALNVSGVVVNDLVGYDMTMISLGNDMYKFRLVGYRDVVGMPAPNSFQFNIYKNSDNNPAPTPSFVVNKISNTNITYNPKDCPPAGADLRLEKCTYESAAINLTALNASTGYYATSGVCCRAAGVKNVLNSSSEGMTFTMDFPRLNTTAPTRNNSSPEFRKAPLTFFCVGKSYTLDWNIVDPNGDSMVYYLAQSYSDGTTKPLPLIDYAPGYNLYYNNIDGVPDLSMNIKTGIINFIPTKVGRYLVAFRVEEWKRASGNTPGYKIGEIRREFQLETTLCPESPPVTTDELNQKRVIVDTVKYGAAYNKIFTSRDSPMDSLYMMIIPDISPGENVLDPVKFGGKWGEAGSVLGNNSNLILDDLAQVRGEFYWKPSCAVVRPKPYKFTIVVRDKTCPSPFYDSTFVTVYVTKKPNNKPTFVSPDTITSNTIKNYYINAGDKFQLAGDSIIKTYDKDSLGNVVSVYMVLDPANGVVNSKFVFSSNPNVIHSTATFSWQTDCKDGRVEPYKIKFIADDNDCSKHDSITFEINIFVAGQSFSATPINGTSTIIDTSLVYTYATSFSAGVNYFWRGKNLTIVSGQGTDSVKVKWNKIGGNQITCVFSSTQTNCVDSSVLNITVATGINDIKNSKIKIYPNPTNNIINIEGLNKNENNTIQIFDVQGKLVISKTINERGTIDLSELNKGIYVIKIGEVAQRIVKM